MANIKNVNVTSLKPGDIVAKDIFSFNSNRLLFSKGKKLTKSDITKLKLNFTVPCVSIIANDNIKVDFESGAQEYVKSNMEEIYNLSKGIVDTLLENKVVRALIEFEEENTYHHSIKVAVFATVLGIKSRIGNKDDLIDLALSALLHDVGKSQIELSILTKPGKLTDKEFELIKTHSKKGYDILKKLRNPLFNDRVCEAVLSHHENQDGTGYPYGKTGLEISVFASIIHIADVYAALTSNRSYKEAWSSEKALEQLEEERNKFNSDLLSKFTNIIKELKSCDQTLETGDIINVSGKLFQITSVDEREIGCVNSFGRTFVFPIEEVGKRVYKKVKNM